MNDPMVGGLTIAERRLRDSSDYINKRIAHMKAAEAWLDVGRELADLKSFLLKQHKGDNTAAGWKAAFAKGKTPFAFSRQWADALIAVHESIGATAVAPSRLPASAKALMELSRVPVSHRNAVIEKCSPGTTATEVRRLAREAGVRQPKKQHADPIESAHTRHVSAVRKLAGDRRIAELRKFAADIGLEHLIRERAA